METLFLIITTINFIILAIIAGLMTTLLMFDDNELVKRLESKLKVLVTIAIGLFTIMLLLGAGFVLIEMLSDTPMELLQ